MLAFIDSPIQIAVVMIVVLLVFGPEKMKDIGKQLGRAIREVRRAGSDFRNTLDGDDSHYDNEYKPPHYDNYNNSTASSTDYSDSYTLPPAGEQDSVPAISAGPAEPEHRGDFAAAALDTSTDIPIDYSAPAAPIESTAAAPVYGVLATPEQSVPRDRAGASKAD